MSDDASRDDASKDDFPIPPEYRRETYIYEFIRRHRIKAISPVTGDSGVRIRLTSNLQLRVYEYAHYSIIDGNNLYGYVMDTGNLDEILFWLLANGFIHE